MLGILTGTITEQDVLTKGSLSCWWPGKAAKLFTLCTQKHPTRPYLAYPFRTAK